MPVRSSCLGFPRIGADRELKRALEGYWSGKSGDAQLLSTASELRRRHWSLVHRAGIDDIPSNDFSLYDHMLDTAVMVGAVPRRFRAVEEALPRYFAMARGIQDRERGIDAPAMEMTKWFDTNYHYIVPEIEPDQEFRLDATKLVAEIDEARASGIETRPVVPGPVTFLMLSKTSSPGGTSAARAGSMATRRGFSAVLLDRLLPVYEQLLGTLADKQVEWLQLDEPCLVLDLDPDTVDAYRRALVRLAACSKRPRIMLATYFGPLRENLALAVGSGFEGLHIDLVRAPDQLGDALAHVSHQGVLSLGVVDGRNIWRTDLSVAHAAVREAVRVLGEDRVFVAPSCSLLHVPIDLGLESGLDSDLTSWLAFAVQKLDEVVTLAKAGPEERPTSSSFAESAQAFERRAASPRIRNNAVRQRVAAIDESMVRRQLSFRARSAKQQARLRLPPLPTTTIGSFPQTHEVRRARSAWRSGKLTETGYRQFIEREIRGCIERQAAWGLDVFVHGEFERNDMVEFFGEQLEGFAFTTNGWVQSYGSRCVKPPVLFGDVSRRRAMTVETARYAQSLTQRPVKGMLTGPVTILQWSFVRDDQPRTDTAVQVAMALRDEVGDLEAAGISVIQVDEPAIREGLPLRRDERDDYLNAAVRTFRLATCGVRDETQIHTHMCYSEFGEILPSIADMDADVLSIESSRSGGELLEDFARHGYPNDVGPGVYDIHSPRVPSADEIYGVIERASRAVPLERLWVNPDCGLKTRGWAEVEPSLKNMVAAARLAREMLVNR